MLSDAELRRRRDELEADHTERKATADRGRLAEVVCAFANDLPDRPGVGVLIVGVHDDGRCADLPIDERLLQLLAGLRTDGDITPRPELTVARRTLDGCTMAVVEVQPSRNPPVRYDGRTCIRIGARRGYATPEEERRLTEKRQWADLPFDQRPVRGSTLGDLDLLRFELEYLPAAIAPDVLAENGRSVVDQLRGLRLIDRGNVPTAAGLLVCGRDPRAWIPGAYIQFVRYPGSGIGDIVADQKEIDGPLSEQFRRLDEVLEANIRTGADLSGAVQVNRASYPLIALQELVRNAVIHRNYEGTAAPVRLTWFADRVEIVSPGGPYGAVTAESFGAPGVTDYRNMSLASAAKDIGFAQRFGSGIPRATAALARNGNPPPEFNVEPGWVFVAVRAAA
jgi:ATP-dependent DNA helicase RecG